MSSRRMSISSGAISPIVTYNKLSKQSVYEWIDRNMLEYTLFNNIIRDYKPSTSEFIKLYNEFSKNEDMPENVFKHIIRMINTNQNTYWGVGPFIKIGERWKIMRKEHLRISEKYEPKKIVFDASTQTNI